MPREVSASIAAMSPPRHALASLAASPEAVPASRTTVRHRARSSAMTRALSAGESASTEKPAPSSRAVDSGRRRAAVTRAFSRATMAGGVPAGATKQDQLAEITSG